MDNFQKVKDFIIKNNWNFGHEITLNTRLFHDLGLTGDDAVDFFVEFSKVFNINTSNFEIFKYFSKEGGVNLIPLLYRFRIIKKLYGYEEFPVRVLVKSLETSELNEETINQAQDSVN